MVIPLEDTRMEMAALNGNNIHITVFMLGCRVNQVQEDLWDQQ